MKIYVLQKIDLTNSTVPFEKFSQKWALLDETFSVEDAEKVQQYVIECVNIREIVNLNVSNHDPANFAANFPTLFSHYYSHAKLHHGSGLASYDNPNVVLPHSGPKVAYTRLICEDSVWASIVATPEFANFVVARDAVAGILGWEFSEYRQSSVAEQVNNFADIEAIWQSATPL